MTDIDPSTRCPRCNILWSEVPFDHVGNPTCPCKMQVVSRLYTSIEQVGTVFCIGDNTLGLYWRLTDKTCYRSVDNYLRRIKSLPWLPFDITKEQLELYETFS